MDEKDRALLRAAHEESVAIGLVALSGVVAICEELVRAERFGVAELERISGFMLASLPATRSSAQTQANLHEAILQQFAGALAQAKARKPES